MGFLDGRSGVPWDEGHSGDAWDEDDDEVPVDWVRVQPAEGYKVTRDSQGRYIPRDGDVIIGSTGTVRRVGDPPRNKVTRAEAIKRRAEAANRVGNMSLDVLKGEAAQILKNFAKLQALLDRFNGQEPPIGSVLRWIKRYDKNGDREILMEGVGLTGSDSPDRELRFSVTAPAEYVYLAFRAPDGKWYTTSRKGTLTPEWEQLVKDIGNNDCQLASEWIDVPAPAEVVDQDIDPTEWARSMFGAKPETSATSEDSAEAAG